MTNPSFEDYNVQLINISKQQKPNSGMDWINWLARFGYAAKGLVYITIGLLAIQVVFGTGGKTTGPSGALESLANRPFPHLLLGITALGLLSYAAWRIVQAWIDPQNEGTGTHGLIKRGAYVISGAIYGTLGMEAADLALEIFDREDGDDGDEQAEEGVAWLMTQPFGIWLVALVGMVIIATGFYQFYRAYKMKFRSELELSEMNPTERTWTIRAGRIGFAARGVVYSLIGGFIVVSAWQANPEQAAGIGESLQALLQQPFGPWLLGIVAIGLIVYGIYAFLLVRYHRTF